MVEALPQQRIDSSGTTGYIHHTAGSTGVCGRIYRPPQGSEFESLAEARMVGRIGAPVVGAGLFLFQISIRAGLYCIIQSVCLLICSSKTALKLSVNSAGC